MKYLYFSFLVIFILIFPRCSHHKASTPKTQVLMQRQDYFLMRLGDLSPSSVQKYRQATQQLRQETKGGGFQFPWRLEGPTNINGRANVLTIHPDNHKVWLVGESTGGIFKTVDGGQSYYPVFDSFNYLSISEIVYHPVNHNIVYAGTGDENISGYPFSGDGVYRSTDGGETWQPFALQDKGIVTTICIHPLHPDTIYVATMGVPFFADSSRGVFRTYDGGASWQQVLLPDTTAGVIDLMLDYNDPQTVYAVGWNRVRTNSISVVSGPQSQLYISHNGGNSWQISNITGNSNNHSRIGIAQTKTANNRLYATVVSSGLGLEGVYYSDNAGQNWQSINTQNVNSIYSGFGWYFGQIRVNPFNASKIYLPGVSCSYYNTATGQWTGISAWHSDHHDIDFFSEDSLIACTDGGIYLSTNGGYSWSDVDNIPGTQFYRVAFNPNVAGEYWGGLQDNGTVKGNNANVNNWSHMNGGDGFQVVFDRQDPSIVYVETQNGGLAWLQSGSWANDFTSGIDNGDRRSWDMPWVNDKNNHFYTGTYRVYKNINAPTGMWTAVSPDLTDGTPDRYHVITALGVSEVNPDMVYAGTSDGHLWRSANAGSSWSEITHTLPGILFTAVEPSPDNANTVYAGQSGYRDGSNVAHIHKSVDAGNNWVSIAGDLPDMAVNAIAIIPHQADSILFVATDGGIYGTVNGGIHWERTGNNMPVIPFYDLVYDSLQRRLVAGSYARGMFSIPLDSIVPGLVNTIKMRAPSQKGFTLYPLPARDFLMTKERPQQPLDISIYDLNGRRVIYRQFDTGEKIRIFVGSLKPGIYLLGIKTGKESISQRMVKI